MLVCFSNWSLYFYVLWGSSLQDFVFKLHRFIIKKKKKKVLWLTIMIYLFIFFIWISTVQCTMTLKWYIHLRVIWEAHQTRRGRISYCFLPHYSFLHSHVSTGHSLVLSELSRCFIISSYFLNDFNCLIILHQCRQLIYCPKWKSE